MKIIKRIIAIIFFVFALSNYSSSIQSSNQLTFFDSLKLLLLTLGIIYISYLLWINEDNESKSFKNEKENINSKKVFKIKSNKKSPPKDITILDFETTGFNFFDDEIIEIGAIKVRDLEIIDEFSTLCNPRIEIKNSHIHGITNEDVQSYKHFSMYIDELLDFIGPDIIMAYNAPFDITFLNIYLDKNIKNRVIDLLRFARIYDKRDSYKLEIIKKDLNINRSSHRAINDCKTALDYYIYLLNNKKINKIHYMKYEKDLDNIRQARKSKNCKYLLKHYKPDLSQIDKSNPFYNKKICITGNLNYLTRDQVFKIILDNGGIIKDNVTLDLDYLIVGEYKNITTKHKKAKEYNKRENVNIKTLNENNFLKLSSIK